MAVVGTTWFKRRVWGWRLAVAIIATQVLGDLVNAFRGDLFRGGVGFVIAGLLLVYLLRPKRQSGFCKRRCSEAWLTNSSIWKMVRFSNDSQLRHRIFDQS